MVVIPKSLCTVSKHFSTHRPLIELLFFHSAVFRETCMDYHECRKALHYWRNVSSRKQEYSSLLEELEQEIVQSLSFQNSGKNFVSYITPASAVQYRQ
ncbi:MAG: hypothetical protein ACI8ZB_002024 [Desulforhopalus sp.]|jgi:hypothetical protein